MNYKLCYFYGLKSKRKLFELLHIERKIYRKGSFVNTKINPWITHNENKKRLIEAPDDDLKRIQGTILRALQKMDYPAYVYSGIKGKSYIDNAKYHENKSNLFKIDISKFFPNTSRDKIYNFYLNKLNMSPDVANILTNFSTVNLDLKKQDSKQMKSVNQFIKDKNINQRNHLITGSPISGIMSYLANIDMFDKIYDICMIYNINMTVYVDDVVFSSNNKIPAWFRKKVFKILNDFGYYTSKSKCKYYGNGEIKKITGVILDKNNTVQVPNKLMLKVHNLINETKTGDFSHKQNLQGCLIATTQINGKLKEFRKQLLKTKNSCT